MPSKPHFSPEIFPSISQHRRDAGTDPQQFFKSGRADAEFFFTPEAVVNAASMRVYTPKEAANTTEMRAARINLDFACGTDSINITK